MHTTIKKYLANAVLYLDVAPSSISAVSGRAIAQRCGMYCFMHVRSVEAGGGRCRKPLRAVGFPGGICRHTVLREHASARATDVRVRLSIESAMPSCLHSVHTEIKITLFFFQNLISFVESAVSFQNE